MIQTQERGAVHVVVGLLLEQIEAFAGKELRPYQRSVAAKICRSILLNEGREFTLLWCRQIGKTEMGMLIIAGLMILIPEMAKRADYRAEFPILAEYRGGFLVGFVAPKLDTARVPFKRLRKLVHGSKQQAYLRSLGITVLVSSTQELTLSNGSSALALSGAETAFQEGHTLHLIWFEETQKIAQYQIRKVFEPMVSATNGTQIKVGTAGDHRCAFLDSIEHNRRSSPEDHSEITWHDVIEIMRREAPGDPWTDRYERSVRKQIDRLPAGEQTESFRMNYLLEWFLHYSQLIAFEQWKRLCADGIDGRPLVQRGQFTDGRRRVFGYDWAKTHDSSVVTAGEIWDDHIRWLDWLELQGTAYDEQLEIIVPWVSARGGCDPRLAPAHVGDSTGVGDPLADICRRLLPRFRGLTYTAQAKDALYKLWQRRLPGERRGTQLLYPLCEKGDREFARFELQFLNCEVETKGNLIAYHHPDTEDEEVGEEVCHDDYVDSGFNTLEAANAPIGSFSAIPYGPSASGGQSKPAPAAPQSPIVPLEEVLAGMKAGLTGAMKGV